LNLVQDALKLAATFLAIRLIESFVSPFI